MDQSQRVFYLKANTIIEPICWGWHAWAHLISPFTAAMNIKNRHIPALEKFLFRSQEKLDIKNQKFEGGPVVQLDLGQKNKIKDLLDYTKKSCNNLISLASSIEKATEIVHGNQGYTFEGYTFEATGQLQLVMT